MDLSEIRTGGGQVNSREILRRHTRFWWNSPFFATFHPTDHLMSSLTLSKIVDPVQAFCDQDHDWWTVRAASPPSGATCSDRRRQPISELVAGMDLNHRHDGTTRLLYREALFPGPGTSRSSELPASYAALAAE